MREFLRRCWPYLKIVLFLLVLAGVGYHFWKILKQSSAGGLWHLVRGSNVAPLILSGVLYLGGLGFFAWFWLWLLQQVGQPLALLPGVRGYYVSHLGKYVPGKGVALLMRTSFAAGAGVRPGAAALTSGYETLTTMAAGAMVAAILLLVQAGQDRSMLWKALGLMVLAGLPIVPAIFNRGVRLLSSRFSKDEEALMPKLKSFTLVTGLSVTSCGWLVFGVSLLAVMMAIAPDQVQLTWAWWIRCTSVIAVSYVVGFLAIFTPGGLGVRELLLQQFLTPTIGAARAVVVVVLLRLLWTMAEVVMATIVYWLPTRNKIQGSPPLAA